MRQFNYIDEDLTDRFTGSFNKFLGNMLPPEDCASISYKIMQSETFQHFTHLWLREGGRNRKAGTSMHSIYGGFLYQEAARFCCIAKEKKELLSLSHQHYETFLEIKEGKKEVNYFVQWQKGLVEELLEYEWVRVEKTLLDAVKFCPDRGEAFQHVIQHFRRAREWDIAYKFSSIAKEQFHGKFPLENRWFADAHFYQWKILNYHASICYHLGYNMEASEAFNLLWKCWEKHPEYFTDAQKEILGKNKALFKN